MPIAREIRGPLAPCQGGRRGFKSLLPLHKTRQGALGPSPCIPLVRPPGGGKSGGKDFARSERVRGDLTTGRGVVLFARCEPHGRCTRELSVQASPFAGRRVVVADERAALRSVIDVSAGQRCPTMGPSRHRAPLFQHARCARTTVGAACAGAVITREVPCMA